MADFSKPEYASYVALCRELRLDREFKDGDWHFITGGVDGIAVFSEAEDGLMYNRTDDKDVWLPSLSDWLEMLDADGYCDLHVIHSDNPHGWPAFYADTWVPGSSDPDLYMDERGEGATAEEAAARLWMAVRKPAPIQKKKTPPPRFGTAP